MLVDERAGATSSLGVKTSAVRASASENEKAGNATDVYGGRKKSDSLILSYRFDDGPRVDLEFSNT